MCNVTTLMMNNSATYVQVVHSNRFLHYCQKLRDVSIAQKLTRKVPVCPFLQLYMIK